MHQWGNQAQRKRKVKIPFVGGVVYGAGAGAGGGVG